ncbi:MAG: hypothetical protein JXR70_09470 [Spirochaetales bacterium]|nr:hypothetical protein [Spirochaetales bacterium]
MSRGKVHELLNEVYQYKNINSDNGYAEAKQRIIRIRLSLATGISMKKFTPDSDDSDSDVERIVSALKGEEFGLQGFSFADALKKY